MSFAHLHCHTQYSILDGAANISEMVKKAKNDNMPAVAITDHGNMFGVFEFVNECNKQGVKAIVGCEFYMVEDMTITSFKGQGNKDKRYHQLLLAKNQEGYKNLATLCSLAYKEGMYNKYPRIDLELLKKHKEGLIATSCCIGAIIPQTILSKGEAEGEKEFKKWHELFGDDFYIELQRHQIENINKTGISQEDLNQILLKWSHRYHVPAICTNDSHYVEQEDAEIHDILLCVNTGAKKSTPIKSDEDDDSVSRDTRFGFPNDQFYFKSTEEMGKLFSDVPFVLENTLQIVEKVEPINLMRDIMMPNFVIPNHVSSQQEYLRMLVFEGAKRKYGEILPAEVIERIELELNTISGSNFEGYFLIIEDFLREARRMNVWVGPGRGSAAGSVVAYCLDITLVDPLKYGLLFERFLNPERVSFPDIDIDFEDEGRQRVLDYVVKKYGKNNVCQIVTFGTMKEKSAIKDVGRVLDIPLFDVNKITNLIPDNVDLNQILDEEKYNELKVKLKPDQVTKAEDFKKLYRSDPTSKKIVDYALKLKGSVRSTGVHACGVIIAPQNLESLIPLSRAKDNEMFVTQFDNKYVEKAGLLKMDFLGLKTLNIMKSIIEIIKDRHQIDIVLEDIPLDDEKTFDIFQKGQTDGIFQFESAGMKKSLIGLKPDKFTDLIAMNALYRPGPLNYIPNYIARKHGLEPVTYDIDASKEILEETYGIMVYQEQVMQLSQKLANFTKGQADSLRKAMGKKIEEEMDKLYTIYTDGCKSNGHDPEKADKIWKDMVKFAQYAFNKSHSTCYALIAYQCAYLKAHFPAEFLAGALSNNMDNLTEVGKFMLEAKNIGIEVLIPNVNESNYRFTVNKAGQIVFGLSAIRGIGEELVKEIVIEREKNGPFSSIFDFVERLSSRVVNKRVLEPLAKGGAFDCFKDMTREQYYYIKGTEKSFIENLLVYASNFHNAKNKTTGSLFGDEIMIGYDKPTPPTISEFSTLDRLEEEKKVIGMYLSGHPLDPFKKILTDVCLNDFSQFSLDSGTVFFGGMVTAFMAGMDKNQNRYAKFTLTNYIQSTELRLKKESLNKFESIVKNSKFILVKLKKKSFTNNQGEVIEFVEILDIIPLEMAYDMINELEIYIDAIDLNYSLIHDLHILLSSHKGKTPVFFSIYDSTAEILKNFDSNIDSDLKSLPVDNTENDRDDDSYLIENNDNSDIDTEDEAPSSPSQLSDYQKSTRQNDLTLLSRNTSVNISQEMVDQLIKLLGPDGFLVKIK